jgi:hypothetical protein
MSIQALSALMSEWRAILHMGTSCKFPQKAAPPASLMDAAFSAQKHLANGELDGQLEGKMQAEATMERARQAEEQCEVEHAAAIHSNIMVRCCANASCLQSWSALLLSRLISEI